MGIEAWKFLKKELIYRGLNGREVHRVYINAEESFILKPFNPQSLELWIYEHVLPAFPPIYPKLVDYSTSPLGEDGWLLFEDLGLLQHKYEEAWAQEVVCLMAWWHNLSIDDLQQSSLKGQKPTYTNMTAILLNSKSKVLSLVSSHNIDCMLILELYVRMEKEKLSDEQVLSHGDLHVGNYTHIQGQLYILDWEHIHLSHRYWDLYHLIDLPHPQYPKKLAPKWRSRLLDLYIEKAMHLDPKLDPHRFLYEYNLFASVFSLWLLLLIEADQMNGNSPWSGEQLSVQAVETAKSFMETVKECL